MQWISVSLRIFVFLVFCLSSSSHAWSQATPPQARLAAWQQRVEMDRTSVYRDLEWSPMGPTRQGGRIEAIAVSGPTIYVGPGSGNLWKSTNNGLTWTPIFEHECSFTIGDVAIAPSDPDVIWVGTGETQPRHSGYSYAGMGVCKSTDGGENWTHLGLVDTHHIGRIVIHPTDPDTVYVAAVGHSWSDNAERGLFKTVDGGEHWEHVLAINDQTGVVDLVMDPEDPDTLYAAAWNKTQFTMAGPESGIYKTEDGGAIWRRLGGGLPEGVDLGRCGLAIAPSSPNVVYAFMDNWAPSGERIVGAEVYRSDDKGQTWNRTHEKSLYGVYTQYGWKFADIRVAPDNENELFILGNRLYHSDDGGRNFEPIEEHIVRLHPHKTRRMHLDQHDMWIDPENPDRVLLGNDGGFYISYDRGHTWLHINNLPIGEFYTVHIEEDRVPFRVYGGTQDNASHMGPGSAQLDYINEDRWSQVFLDRWGGGDGFVTLPDPTDSDWIYYEHQHGDMWRKKLGGSPLTGADGDQHIRPRASEGEQPYRFGWHTPFVISHYDPRTLYVGANKLLKSTNRGEAWTAVSPEFAADPELGNRAAVPLGVITSISESRLQAGLIYVGLENGQIHYTQDDGRTWTKCYDGIPQKWVSRVIASRHDLGTVYVSLTGFREDDFAAYLYRSTDSGKTWNSLAHDLPAESINVIREDPKDPNILYIGTDMGVFVSTDTGGSWQSLSTTLPTTPVHDLAIHARKRQLIAATHGRSMFSLDVSSVTSEPPVTAAEKTLIHQVTEDLTQQLEFRSIGPTFKPGRIADIEVDPANDSIWYVAHGSGGLWKTTNRGTSWTSIFDDGGSYSLGCVTVDPKNSQVVWLGTGENISNRSVGYGDGVYKSTDGGESWSNVGLRDSQHIAKILIDPRDSNTVYVAAEGPLWGPGGDRGLYKTIDGGRSWHRVLSISDDTGVTNVAMDPRDPNVLYASAFQRRRRVGQLIGGGPESGIYKTTDGGQNWQKLSEGLPSVDMGRIALAISPQKPDVVYALVTAAGDAGGLFRSSDRGQSWQRNSDFQVIDPQYYGELFADPHQFDRLIAMDVRIQISEDGGRTFQPVRWNMHVDNHDMIIDPEDANHLLVGNDGGVYESHDRGRTWRHFTNLPTAQFYRVALDDATPFYNVYGGTQDNGSMAGPSRTTNQAGIRTSEWFRTGGADGFQTRIEPGNRQIIYTLSQNGGLQRFNMQTGSRVNLQPEPESDDSVDRWHWDSPLLISPHSPTRLYFAGNRLYRSDDRGDHWQAVSDDLTRQLDANTLPIMGRVWGEDAVQKNRFTTTLSVITALDESKIQEGLLAVGTDDGLVHISPDGGGRWSKHDDFPDIPEGTYVSDICLSQHNINRLYVSLKNHKRDDFHPYLIRSDDGGKTWTSIAANLPHRHVVWCVIEDHFNEDLLFVGTELGVFCTVDRGQRWFPLKNGLPTAAVRDLAIHPREHDLVAATFGRGFYILDDMSILRHMRVKSFATAAELFPPRDTWVYDELSHVEAVFGNAATPNPRVGVSIWYFLKEAIPERSGSRLSLSIESREGVAVQTFNIPTTAGVNRVHWDLRRKREGNNQNRRRPGPLTDAGHYRVKLVHVTEDEAKTVGTPRVFRLESPDTFENSFKFMR